MLDTTPEGARARARAARRSFVVLATVLVALALTAFGICFRDGPAVGVAVAAPRAKAVAGAGDAGVPGDAGAAPTAQTPASEQAPGDGGAPEAIDLAVAPDGGVPFHVERGPYRSPFAMPGKPSPAARAKVALLLNSVDDYEVKTGTFSADFFLSFTSPTPMPKLNLSFANGSVDKTESIADTPTFKLFRMMGKFKSPPNLRNYPFDTQDLKILIEDDIHGIDQLRFSVDKERTQLARGFRALGWQVNKVEARALSQSYPDRFEGDDLYYSRYVFSLEVERFATSAAFKVFVPAFVIVLISLLGMWVPPEEMEVRSNSGAPMLAGAVLFHFALMQELPATSYMTRADKVMLGVYVSLLLGMMSTWWMFLVKEKHMETVFRVARVTVPILNVLVMAAACLL